jgi:hypothetical protein
MEVDQSSELLTRGTTMRYGFRVFAGVCALSFFAAAAEAQNAPTAPKRNGPAKPAAGNPPRNANGQKPAALAQRAPRQASSSIAHRSWPYQPSNEGYGFRNPGGVGRMAEYYPPGDRFQNDSPRHVTAQIGNGGQPDRNEQLQAEAVGVQRYNALQSHIDRYGAPFGFGYGWGMGYGFGFR